ncbi:tRNA uridine-5-carboxymethylaminomethyl(34) synthesis GTPase MnmE [Devosia sp. PTR5]|uniref:tRNA modification GTPase MnmE n=1 Tax=Devosia oryzisoli TaxID=2774138 RepID=A0A927FVW1_9HYPH|nr:tRNA uridine-5-carboxymethylaminomethyl(34) synthesis GTPase MnmE [Devosia oryzisoli]MBD8066487.1 tRNA uridine-5-carboxymethylaminomethyl(34) synthesis GTPase MnmE [Devosia oryzisoli]
MTSRDTIMALSSGAPPSGVAVIRLSGPQAREALSFMAGEVPPPRTLALRSIGAGTRLDQGLVAFFPRPASFTGEDCVELHVHGSPAGVKAILRQLSEFGLRLAQPGEFTRRAFENGKLDLVSVEGLGDLLSAETESQRQQALARYDGRFTAMIDNWRDELLDLRAELEARLDFSDEGDVEESLPGAFQDQLAGLVNSLTTALLSLSSGRIVREGIRVAIAGAPNAGKSSLINALSQSDVAIVSPEAGTTRDVREVPLDIAGQLYLLLDLAGLRDADSLAEAEGVRRARRAIADADIVLWLVAPDVESTEPEPFASNVIVVHTKSDLAHPVGATSVSSVTGEGIGELIALLQQRGSTLTGAEPSVISHERDRQALTEALDAVVSAGKRIEQWELAAEDLRLASASLERLIGRLDPERVLDRLFSSFCIGK